MLDLLAMEPAKAAPIPEGNHPIQVSTLRSTDSASPSLEMWLWIFLCRALPAQVRRLRDSTEDGSLWSVWLDLADSLMKKGVQITRRDRELIELLGRARWLSTAQIQRRFFPGKSSNAVQKRMRILNRVGYIRSVARGMSDEHFHKLGRKAAALLNSDQLVVPRRLPVQLKHMSDVNCVRLAFEEERRLRRFPLEGFWSESELKSVEHAWPVVPDGVAAVMVKESVKYLAIEVDEGTESPRLVRDKLDHYRDAGMASEGFVAVLIYAAGWPRVRSLVRILFGRDWTTGPPGFLGDVEQLCAPSGSSQKLISLAELDQKDGPSLASLQEVLSAVQL